MKDVAEDLRNTIDREATRLAAIPAEKARFTLEYFARDYVAHLKHHLAQIPG